MSRQSICGKCKTVRLPHHLAVHVKVRDDYKIVCILRAREIKCLATTVRWQVPGSACSHLLVFSLFSPSSFTWSLPFLFSICGRRIKVQQQVTQTTVTQSSQKLRLQYTSCLTFNKVFGSAFICSLSPLSRSLLDHVGCSCSSLKRLKVLSNNPFCLSCWRNEPISRSVVPRQYQADHPVSSLAVCSL